MYVKNEGKAYIDEYFYEIADSIGIEKKLSISEIKSCSNLEKIGDEEALEIIESLFKLTIITLKIYKEHESRNVSSICQRA